MNFKVDRVQEGEIRVVLNLCGRINSEQLDTIKGAIEKEAGSVVLDLTQITLADRPSVIFLAQCELQGIEIRNAPAFLTQWIAKERKRMPTAIRETSQLRSRPDS